MRELVSSRPVRTDVVLNGLLTGSFDTIFEREEIEGTLRRRSGRTRSGLPVHVYIQAYPDGYRDVVLTLGARHVLEVDDVDGVVAIARLQWLDAVNNYRPRSRRLYYDAATVGQARRRWAEYCRRVSVADPSLPRLELPAEYRQAFVSLYEGEPEGTFGTFCDYAGIPPDQRVAQVKLLASGRITALRYVLRSRFVVSRLYAAEALLVLKRGGYRMDRGDAELIDQLAKDGQMVDTCHGGVTERRRAGDAVRLFTTDGPRRLVSKFKKLGYLK